MHVYQSAGQNIPRSKEKLKVDKIIYYLDEHHAQEIVITAVGCTSTEQTFLKDIVLKTECWSRDHETDPGTSQGWINASTPHFLISLY